MPEISSLRRRIGLLLLVVLWFCAVWLAPSAIRDAQIRHTLWRVESGRISYEAATDWFDGFIEKHPGAYTVYFHYGVLLERRPVNWDKADVMFRRALDLNPALAPAHDYLAQIYGHTGRDLLSIRHYLLAEQAEPDNPIYPYHLGAAFMTSYRTLAEYEGLVLPEVFGMAYRAYARARTLAPGEYRYAVNLANMSITAEHLGIPFTPHHAIQLYLACLDTDANDQQKSNTWRRIGQIWLIQLHNIREARKAFKRAWALTTPPSPALDSLMEMTQQGRNWT